MNQQFTVRQLLQRLRPARLEIIDPQVSPRLIELARHLDLPVDLWITSDRSLSYVDAASRLLAPTVIAEAFTRAKSFDARPPHGTNLDLEQEESALAQHIKEDAKEVRIM